MLYYSVFTFHQNLGADTNIDYYINSFLKHIHNNSNIADFPDNSKNNNIEPVEGKIKILFH